MAVDPEPVEMDMDIGKYGRPRLTDLKQHQRKLYRELVDTGKFRVHLLNIHKTANDWMDRVMPKMAKAAGAIEDLKAHDQMVCVGLMNSCKVKLEESIIAFKGVAYCCPMDGRRKESRGKHDK